MCKYTFTYFSKSHEKIRLKVKFSRISFSDSASDSAFLFSAVPQFLSTGKRTVLQLKPVT